MQLMIAPRTLRFRSPVHTAHGLLRDRRLLLVGLGADGGSATAAPTGDAAAAAGSQPVGNGEAAPLPSYDSVSIERTAQALERHRHALAQAGDLTGELRSEGPAAVRRLIDLCRAADPLPQALAAIDGAAWDLAGKLLGAPVHRLLKAADAATAAVRSAQADERPRGSTGAPGSTGRSVAVNATIAALAPDAAAAQARAAVAEGFRCLKLKVGVGADLPRVEQVRAAIGADVALRLDANGAWGVQQAIALLCELGPLDIELVEEPVHGLQALAQVRASSPVPVALDESAAEPGALEAGAADLLCLKLSRCGGLMALLEQARAARGAGIGIYVASSFEGPLGVAAGLHAALALARSGPLAACGLATLQLFEGFGDVLPVHDGTIALPDQPGLGVLPP